MLFIITEHINCNVCKKEMRGRGKGSQIGEGWMAALLLFLILPIHSQDHHELSEERKSKKRSTQCQI